MREVEREKANLPVYGQCPDDGVKRLKELIVRYYNQSLDKDMLRNNGHIRGLVLALEIYRDNSVSGFRDIMEAGLLAEDADIEFFQAYVSRFLTPRLVKLYQHLFFDVAADRDKPFWVHKNIFVPNRSITRKDKFDTAYMWKVVAYGGGIDKFSKYAIDGKHLEPELAQWMQGLGISTHVKEVLKSIHTGAKLIDSAGTPAASLTALWHKESTRPDDDNTHDDRAMLAEVFDALESAIRRPDESMTLEDEMIAINKFQDEV